MAERKNFLDREKEKRDGENYLPYSIALIPGLTALEQDALVNDVSSRIVDAYNRSRFVNGKPDDIHDIVEGRKKADFLESSIQRMPEPLRDSWLMTVSADDALPVFFGSDKQEAFYKPSTGEVYMDKDLFRLRPNALIHEYAHKTNHDLNKNHPAYKGVQGSLVPDRMLEISLGREINKDLPKSFPAKVGAIGRQEFIEETARRKNRGDAYKKFFEEILENSGIYEPIRYGELFKLPKDKSWNKMEMMSRRNEFVSDAMTLNPSFRSDIYDLTARDVMGYGHPKGYLEQKAGYTRNLLDAMKENGVHTREYNVSPEYAALSLEGPAELADFMSTEGGEEDAKSKFPKTYERMMLEYRNDPRRELPKRNIPAWVMYSHESPYNVYEYRGEPVPYNKDEVRRYTRVPDPYGGWYYGDDFQDVRKNALRQKKNYVEYRDLDGNWKRYYPEELKHVDAKLTTTKDFAKMLGKKILKGAK